MSGITTAQWREMVRFELVNQFRRKSLRFLFALFLFPLIGITGEGLADAQSRELAFNAPIFLAENSVIMSLIALLLIAVVGGEAATRDVQTRMEPLLHAAPLDRAAYVGGRFLGAFLVMAILLAVVPLVHLLVPLFNSDVTADVVGTVRAAAYLQNYFLLIVPNAFVATAFVFALATLARHTVAGYGAAGILFAGVQLSFAYVGETLGRWDLATFLDSTGFTALSVISRSWSPVELNERLIGSESALLWNRLLWIFIALAVLAFTIRGFNFGGNRRLLALSPRKRGEGGQRPGEGPPSAPVVVHPVPRTFGVAARVRQTLAIARDSLRELATPWTLLALPFFALKVLFSIQAIKTMGGGTTIFPTTGRVLAPLDDVPPPVVLAIIMFPVIVAGEMLWRERDANMESLADSAPVPDGVRFFGKLLGLWSVMVAVHALLIVAALVTQVSLGWYDFEPALLFQIVFGLELVDALVFALFALSLHILANQKHVGHLLIILLIAASNILAETFAIEHPLLLLGFEPEWRHSPISGFGPYLGPVLSFELYWAAWVLFLALVARLFWVRGVERECSSACGSRGAASPGVRPAPSPRR